MVRQPKTVTVDSRAGEAVRLMESNPKHPVMVLPVVDEKGFLKGLVRMHDLVQAGCA